MRQPFFCGDHPYLESTTVLSDRASGVYIFIYLLTYLYVYNKLQNGYKDPVKN